MGGAALQQAELDAAHLRAGLFLHDIRQRGGKSAELRMTEAVGRGGLRLGDERAVGIVDAFGDGDDAVAVLLIGLGDLGDELIHVEIDFRQIDEVHAMLFLVGKRGGGGQPTGVTAHALDDRDHAGVVDLRVARDFHDGSGNILGGGSEARAVIGAEQVVVDRLGHAHDHAVIADLLHIFGDLVAGVHRVVAAVIAEIADVVLLEDFQNALVIGVVLVGIGDLIAAGAERRRRRIRQAVKLGAVFRVHAQQFVFQHALDAVVCAVDLGDGARVQRGADHTVSTGVDDRRRTAGLPDDQCAFEWCIHKFFLLFDYCPAEIVAQFSEKVNHTIAKR